MIKSIEIKNIQSHEHSRLEFSKGINVIVGSSNCGKSAILRSLYWVKNNRPLGIDTLASHWIVDDKGKLTDEMRVVVDTDRGYVERRRDVASNQYIVDGLVFDVVKGDVIDEASSVLKLSDTNVQKQMDAPFLLSNTSGEVARYFNSMVNLNVIDKVLSKVEGLRRSGKSKMECCKDDVAKYEGKVKELDWLDSVTNDVEACRELLDQLVSLDSKIDAVATSIDSFNSMVECKKLYESLLPNRSLICEMNDCFDSLSRIDGDLAFIENSLDKVNSCVSYDTSQQKLLVGRIDYLISELKKCEVHASLGDSVSDYDYYNHLIMLNAENIKTWNSMLPSICPLCGSRLKEDEDA